MHAGAAPQAYPRLALARFAQAVLFAIGVITSMDLNLAALLIEPMKHDLRLTDVQVGLATSTAFYSAYGLLCIPMGMLVDRLSRVRLLLAAILLWCGGLGLCGLSHALWPLICGKAMTGVGAAISYPAAMSLFSDYFAPNRRAMATASYAIGQTLGGAAAMLVGGLGFAALTRMAAAGALSLYDIAPWRVVSLIFAALGFLLIPVLIALPEPARREIGDRSGQGSLRELWAYRRFLAPTFLAMMFLSGLSSGVLTWIAPSLMRLYGRKPGDFAGWLSATILLGGILGMVAAARLVETARRRGAPDTAMAPAAGCALVLAAASCMAITPNVICFALATAAFIFCSGVAIAVPVVVINFRIPNELRGLSMGLYVLLVAIAGGVSAPLTAFVSGLLGGDMMIGRAMAVVGAPVASLAALCLWAASRANDERAVELTSLSPSP